MQVLFRFDANADIGYGHLMRSAVLARSLRNRGHAVRILSRGIPASLKHHLDGMEYSRLAGEDDGFAFLDELARKHPIDWLVIDHYDLDARWEGLASKFVERTLVIDDLANRDHICDALLDQNLPNSLQTVYEQLTPPACKRWIGPRYLLARPGFYQPRVGTGAGLMVFLGGGDHRQKLSDLLPILTKTSGDDEVKLVITQAYGSENYWQRQLGSKGRVYKDLLETADLCRSVRGAVVRCGFIAYELSLVGTPMVVIYGTPIQKEVACALESLGYGIAMAEEDMLDIAKMRDCLDRMNGLKPVPMSSLHSSGSEQIARMMESFDDY